VTVSVCVCVCLWVVRKERVTGKGTCIHTHRGLFVLSSDRPLSSDIKNNADNLWSKACMCISVCVFTLGRYTAEANQKYGQPPLKQA